VKVITFVRLARVVLLLVLAVVTVSLVIGVARRETGAVEKAVLLALIAGCILLAAKITTWETRLEGRIRGT
jgi:hypothetical protein